MLRTTDDFAHTRTRADRAGIRDEGIILAIEQPVAVAVQGDGRNRRWAYIAEAGRYRRVVLLADALTVHNAFFDHRFEP